MLKAYLGRIWLAIDILLNVILGGDVETMSSRMGRKLRDGVPCRICRGVCGFLSVFWPDHCIHNIQEKK